MRSLYLVVMRYCNALLRMLSMRRLQGDFLLKETRHLE